MLGRTIFAQRVTSETTSSEADTINSDNEFDLESREWDICVALSVKKCISYIRA